MAYVSTHRSSETRTLDALAPEWRQWIAVIAWQIYGQLDPTRELFTVKKWLFSYTVRVKDARPLLVLLFGEPLR